jgi:hypothetical protein
LTGLMNEGVFGETAAMRSLFFWQCPLLAQSGHALLHCMSPLLTQSAHCERDYTVSCVLFFTRRLVAKC